jgi:hypothetical protein
LRHVTDTLAHCFGFGLHVEAFHLGRTAAQRQQTGEHLDDSGFSAAVGSEKAENFAFLHAEAEVVNGGETAEPPHKMLGGDGCPDGRWGFAGHRLSPLF